jgi:hypothetical protein
VKEIKILLSLEALVAHPIKFESTGSNAIVKIDSIIGVKHQIINSHFTPIESDLRLIDNSKISGIGTTKQGSQ